MEEQAFTLHNARNGVSVEFHTSGDGERIHVRLHLLEAPSAYRVVAPAESGEFISGVARAELEPTADDYRAGFNARERWAHRNDRAALVNRFDQAREALRAALAELHAAWKAIDANAPAPAPRITAGGHIVEED